MAHNFAKGKFTMKNPQKYIGLKVPYYRSSWELNFCMFCDTSPSIQKWASEAVNIPYKDPLSGRNTIYVPDFFIQYLELLGSLFFHCGILFYNLVPILHVTIVRQYCQP